MRYLQGVLALTRTTEDTAGTTIVTGSHRHVAELYQNHTGQFCKLSNAGLAVLKQKNCTILHLSTDPGDLVVWAEETTHCGRLWRGKVPGLEERFAAYITFARAVQLENPHATAAFKRRAIRLNANNKAVGVPHATSHHPAGAAGGGRCLERKNRGVQRTPEMALTNEALLLVGILPYNAAFRGRGFVLGGNLAPAGPSALQQKLTITLDQLRCSPRDVRGKLDELGALVIKNVVSAEDCRQAAGDLKKFLRASGIDVPRDGIVREGGAGGLECLWQLRLHPNVRAAYAMLLGGSEELVVSLDGFNAATPCLGGERDGVGQFGVDHDRFTARAGVLALQGLLALTQTTEMTSGTSVVLY